MTFSSVIQGLGSIFGGPAVAILQQQNYWNSPEAEAKAKKISSEDVLTQAQEATKGAPVQGRHFDLQFPAKSPWRITSPYGKRVLTIDGKKVKREHIGIDINGARDIFAPEDMIVKKILELDKKYPNRFFTKVNKTTGKTEYFDAIAAGKVPAGRAWTPYILAMGIHTKTMYKFKHTLVKGKVAVGQELSCGDLFGLSGDYGYSQGPHCHHEVWLFQEKAVKSAYEGILTNWPAPMDPAKYYKDYGVV